MQRIMRQRALSVDLNPDIEDACMVELGDMCSEDKEDVEKGAVSVGGGVGWNWVLCSEDKEDVEKGAVSVGGGGVELGAVL